MTDEISLPTEDQDPCRADQSRVNVNVNVQPELVESLIAHAQARGTSVIRFANEALAAYLREGAAPSEAQQRVAPAKETYALNFMVAEHADTREISGVFTDCLKHLDFDGIIRSWSLHLEQMLGYRGEEVLNQPMLLICPNPPSDIDTLFARVANGDYITDVDTQLRHKDGHLLDAIISLFPWWEHGTIVGVVAICRDVSALKRRERDAAYIAAVARVCNSIMDGTAILEHITELTARWADSASVITFERQQARLVTYATRTPTEDAEAEIRALFIDATEHHPDTLLEWEVFTTTTAVLRSIRDLDLTVPLRHVDLARGYHTVASVPIFAAGEIVGVLSARSRTLPSPFDAQTLVTLALVAEQAGFAFTKTRLLEQVREQVDALEKAMRYKDDFLAALSHELRTPLTAILGFAVMIVEKDTLGFMRRREMAEDIVASAALMRSLVNDLLNVVQLQEGQLQVRTEAVELSALVQWCQRLIHPLMDVKRQTVEIQIPVGLPPVQAERTQLEQAILNLLINANKYTLPGGAITVEARLLEGQVALSVRDTGIGISLEDATRVFERFERGNADYSRAQGGAGIGLAISKQVVEMMGGTLTMESVVGQGSTFTITLPIHR